MSLEAAEVFLGESFRNAKHFRAPLNVCEQGVVLKRCCNGGCE